MKLVGLLLLVGGAAAGGLGLFGSLTDEIKKDVVAVQQPLTSTAFDVVFSQCDIVKKIFGVHYDQIQGKKEPDLSKLTLNFITNAVRVTYNLTTAAEFIPREDKYNPRAELIIFIHGFTDDPTKNSFGKISQAFLSKGQYNILALDGSSVIAWLYLRSSTFVRFMGARLGEVLAAMAKAGQQPASIHLIGHSLGAHIASFAGKTFRELTGTPLGRISGLDPAGPCFNVEPQLRLAPEDAAFVDVIHTDSGVFGLKDPVGQVDFYPNGGLQQPGCVLQTCDHNRVWQLYGESIIFPRSFPAVRCKDYDQFRNGQCERELTMMGYYATPGTRGQYYFQTNGESPLGRGEDGTWFKNEEGLVRNVLGGRGAQLG